MSTPYDAEWLEFDDDQRAEDELSERWYAKQCYPLLPPIEAVERLRQKMGKPLPRVYCWCNQSAGTDFQHWYAMAEDGEIVTSHICSHESWARTDLLDRKHDLYDEKFGGHEDGVDFLLVWEVAPPDVYERNQTLAKAAGGAEKEDEDD